MRNSFFRILVFISAVLFLMPGASFAQSGQTGAANPPIAQPLVREGDLAFKLVPVLGLGTPADEVEAESTLTSTGIMPRNGWIADYPVTPDIIGEVRASIGEAADSGSLPIGKDSALMAFQNVIKEYGLSVRAAEGQAPAQASNQPASTTINNYYNTEGPPVVTYFAPPPYYAYMYTWVPYPFWWASFWYPGFFILVDFDVRVRTHIPDHGPVVHRREIFITNHFREPRTKRILRIDPTHRFGGVTFHEFRGTRGFSEPRPFKETHPSAFDRFGSGRYEGAASKRGFESRSGAGLIPHRPFNRVLPGKRENFERRKAPEEGSRDNQGGRFRDKGRSR